MILEVSKLLKTVKYVTLKRFKSSVSNDIRNIGILAHIDAGKEEVHVFESSV